MKQDEANIMTCSLCGEPLKEFLKISYPFFRHLDFETIKPHGTLSRCSTCQLVANQITEEDTKVIRDMFESETYMRCQLMTHTICSDDSKVPETRSALQARLLREKLHISNPAILDIGCFTGELLLELNSCFEAANLHGFDVSEDLFSHFPSNKNFHYWSGDLAVIDRKFDVIILSGSIMYIKEIQKLILHGYYCLWRFK